MQMFGRFHFFERKEAKGSPVPSIHAYFEFLHEDRPEFWLTVPGVGDLRFKRRTSGAIFELVEVRPIPALGSDEEEPESQSPKPDPIRRWSGGSLWAYGRFHFATPGDDEESPPGVRAHFEFLNEDRAEFWVYAKSVAFLCFKRVRRTLYQLAEARPEVGPLPRGGGLSQREIEWLREQWSRHAGGYTAPSLDFSGLRRALRTLKSVACGRGPRPNCGGSSALHPDGV